jgi:hypothetical protein
LTAIHLTQLKPILQLFRKLDGNGKIPTRNFINKRADNEKEGFLIGTQQLFDEWPINQLIAESRMDTWWA